MPPTATERATTCFAFELSREAPKCPGVAEPGRANGEPQPSGDLEVRLAEHRYAEHDLSIYVGQALGQATRLADREDVADRGCARMCGGLVCGVRLVGALAAV
jgi:hypothetical protein